MSANQYLHIYLNVDIFTRESYSQMFFVLFGFEASLIVISSSLIIHVFSLEIKISYTTRSSRVTHTIIVIIIPIHKTLVKYFFCSSNQWYLTWTSLFTFSFLYSHDSYHVFEWHWFLFSGKEFFCFFFSICELEFRFWKYLNIRL